jgi:hypothetical protein
MSARLNRILTLWAFALLFSAMASADSISSLKLTGNGVINAAAADTDSDHASTKSKLANTRTCDSASKALAGEGCKLEGSNLRGAGTLDAQLLNDQALGLIFASYDNRNLNPGAGSQTAGQSSTDGQDDSFDPSGASSDVTNQYVTTAWSAPNSDFNGLVLYTPVPLNYVQHSVPEPASFALAGMALLAMGLVFRKRLLQQPARG